jgi:hypothetical protein
MRLAERAGRWAWGLCGLATAAALVVPGTRLVISAGEPGASAKAGPQPRVLRLVPQTQTMTVPQPVTSLNVQSSAGLIQVTAAPVTQVQVTETYVGSPPALAHSVSGGRLSLAVSSGHLSPVGPPCARPQCSVSLPGAVSLAVTVPLGVTVAVTAAGGPVFISGTSGADVDSLDAPVVATSIDGPLTVSTHRAPLQVNGLTGPLRADTGGGQVIATRVDAATAVVSTEGGPAQITFSAAPESVTINTGGGPAELTVPGGPYALTANSNGAPQIIGINTSSAAPRSITVTTGGGQLVINSGELPGTPPLLPLSMRIRSLPFFCAASPATLACGAGSPAHG